MSASRRSSAQLRRDPLPGVAAGFVDGGHGQVPKVCKLARQLGFRVIAALDCDVLGAGADLSFAA